MSDQLNPAVIQTLTFGSALYKTNIKNSDTDLFHIIATPQNISSSFLPLTQSLQYKENKKDHIFSTPQAFIHNLITGESTINFELLFEPQFKAGPLGFISSLSEEITYTTLKSYLGLIKRDFRQFSENREKKLYHALRGLWTFEQLRANQYQNDLSTSPIYELLMKIRHKELGPKDLDLIKGEIETKTDQYRLMINQELGERKIPQTFSKNKLLKLDQKLNELTSLPLYRSKIINHFWLDRYSLD